MTLGDLILQYCQEHEMTTTQFALKSDINRSYIYILRNVREPGIQVVKKVARTMGMSFEEIADKIEFKLPRHMKRPNAKEVPLFQAMPMIDDNIIGNAAVLSLEDDATFAYRIPDNDMSPYIFKNAIVIAKSENPIKNDAVVIASIDGKTYCRKYLKTGDGIYLIPVNPKAETLFYNKQEIKTMLVIHGVVTEVRFPV